MESAAYFLVFAILSLLSKASKEAYVHVDGDVVLGAIVPVHERGDQGGCGRINRRGIQAVQAILKSLDDINSSGVVPFKIGVAIFDNCDRQSSALVKFSGYFLPNGNRAETLSTGLTCPSGGDPGLDSGLKSIMEKVVGVIIGTDPRLDLTFEALSGVFNFPVVSYRTVTSFPTEAGISSLYRFHRIEELLRTTPDGGRAYAVEAYCQLFRRLHWNYISIVSEDTYISAVISDALQRCLNKHSMCIASHIRLPTNRGRQDFEWVIQSLKYNQAKAVVLISGGRNGISELLKEIRKDDIYRQIQWFDGGVWTASGFTANDVGQDVPGVITVQPDEVPGFEEYFQQSLTSNIENDRNPWLREYGLDNSTNYSAAGENSYDVIFAKRAVYSFSYALKTLSEKLCQSSNVCQKLLDDVRRGDYHNLPYHTLRNVTWSGDGDGQFFFKRNGTGRASFVVKQLSRGNSGQLTWKDIGTYTETKSSPLELDIHETDLQRLQSLPPSVCSKPCRTDERKSFQRADGCCWVCIRQ